METLIEQRAKIAAADQGRPRKKIVVLGAGMAGLSAAYELNGLGHDVTILEATGRPGGRVRTQRFKSTGQYHELGAMRIPASHDFTRYFIQKAGLTGKLRPFISHHRVPNCFYHIRGKVCRIREASSALFDEFRLSAFERQIANEMVAPAIFGLQLENAWKSFSDEDKQSLFGMRFLTDRVAQLERQTLGEFLERRVSGEDTRELIGVTTGLEVWWNKAVSMILRDELMKTGDGLEEIEGGMDLLPFNIAAKLPKSSIQFNTEVLSIELIANGVRLRTRPTTPQTDDSNCDNPPTDGPIEVLDADHVICTIPFGVLRRMDLGGLSALKMRAIRNLNYASSTKVLLHCKQRFWEMGTPDQQIIGGASLSDGISRSTYYPSDHHVSAPTLFATQTNRQGLRGVHSAFSLGSAPAVKHAQGSPGPGVLVGSYNWGRDAQRLGALPPAERAMAVIDNLRNFHPNIDAYVDDAKSMYWDTYRWSRGAFCFMQPGDLKDYYHAAIRPEGRLHFAGEHCSLDQAWIQGAVISGLRAVYEIAAI